METTLWVLVTCYQGVVDDVAVFTTEAALVAYFNELTGQQYAAAPDPLEAYNADPAIEQADTYYAWFERNPH